MGRDWFSCLEETVAYALVGSEGTVATGTTSCTPSYPQAATAGHLLVVWVSNFGSAGFPTTPAGYSNGAQKAGSSAESISIFYKIAAGTESGTLSISGMSGSGCAAKINEYSGNASSSPLDENATGSGSTSPATAAAIIVDGQSGDLVVYGHTFFYSTANTKTTTPTMNNGATANQTKNDSTSTVNHYNYGWGITTGNAAGDSISTTFTTTKISGTGTGLVSFSPAAGVTVQIPTSFAVLQAVNRTSNF